MKENKKIEYLIFKPGGNDTALVYGLEFNDKKKKQINDEIMKKHSNVEQVGFIDLNKTPQLEMAGGEFCGNATRSAAYVYLNGKQGNIQITVNSKDTIKAGISNDRKAWSEIPLYEGKDKIVEKEEGVYIVKIKGIIIVVIQPKNTEKYIKNKETLKEHGKHFIEKYHLEQTEAVGVMFCEKINDMLKINPIVWVKSINTLFYETACGSGTTAVCMVEAYKNKASKKVDIMQPSGMTISSEVIIERGKITRAIISGDVMLDDRKYLLEIGGGEI